MEDNRFPGFPVLKGLQQPLEFMGIQGRYIYWAAAAVGGAIVGFIIAYCIAGFVAGLVVLLPESTSPKMPPGCMCAMVTVCPPGLILLAVMLPSSTMRIEAFSCPDNKIISPAG